MSKQMTNKLKWNDFWVFVDLYLNKEWKWECDDWSVYAWVRPEKGDYAWIHNDGRKLLKLSFSHKEGDKSVQDNRYIYDTVADWLDGLTEEQLIDGAEEVEEEPPSDEDMRSAAADQKFHEMRDDGLI